MAQTTALKGRIKSVRNTRQITKAMELVSASKMRRAQETALRTREYSHTARAILARLRELTDVSKHPLYVIRKVKTRLYIVLTSNQGLAGAYDSNVLRRLAAELGKDAANGVQSQIIMIGKKGANFVARFENVEIIAIYNEFTEKSTAADIRPILNTVIEKFTAKEVDVVDVLFTDYKSSINQIVTVQRVLPAAFTDEPVSPDLEQAEFEPSPEAVLELVTRRLVEAELSQAFLESQASEQSMRMMAMKNASDNASDIIDDLTLAFNTARQAAITQELAEITGGAEAIR